MKRTLSAVLAAGVMGFFSLPVLQAADNVGYDKGFFVKSDDDEFKLTTNIQLQPQYQLLVMEGGANNINTFQIRRGRLVFSGNAFGKPLTYRFQFEGVSGRISSTRDGSAVNAAMTGPNMREAYLNYKFADQFQIRAGQFKPMFNREELTSSTSLQFVDRSLLNEVMTHGYDLGMMFHGAAYDQKLEYGLFVTNEGNNRNNFNFNNEVLVGGRVNWNVLGQHGYSQSDVKNSEDHQLSTGVAFSVNKPVGAAEDTISNYTGDVGWKYRGFSFHGEGGLSIDHTASTKIFGFLGQAGYFIVPEKFEVAARGAGVIPTAAGLTNGYEIGGTLNYFIKGHNFKLQTDYGMLINSSLVLNGASNARNSAMVGGAPGFAQDQTDHRIRTQLQLYF